MLQQHFSRIINSKIKGGYWHNNWYIAFKLIEKSAVSDGLVCVPVNYNHKLLKLVDYGVSAIVYKDHISPTTNSKYLIDCIKKMHDDAFLPLRYLGDNKGVSWFRFPDGWTVPIKAMYRIMLEEGIGRCDLQFFGASATKPIVVVGQPMSAVMPLDKDKIDKFPII